MTSDRATLKPSSFSAERVTRLPAGSTINALRHGVSLTALAAAIVLPGMFIPDAALAACAPGAAICVTQNTDAGNPAVVGSFSWAIAQANAGGNQTIGFDSTVFSGANTTLTLTGTNVQTPRLSAGVTIDGSGVSNLTINGSGQREILFIRPDAPDPANPINVTLKGVTLANGRAKGGDGGDAGYGGGGGMGAGGAIFVGKGVNLSAENVTLSGNNAAGGIGGSQSQAKSGSGGGGLNGGNGTNLANVSGANGGGGGGMGAGNSGIGSVGGGAQGGTVGVGTTPAGAGGAYSGGGGAVQATPDSKGGDGGYGGGGGGGSVGAGNGQGVPRGGAGGFGGGGGGAGNYENRGGIYTPGGAGGFGGGAGGGYNSAIGASTAEQPGFGGGKTGGSFVGGGGAGFGGAIFIEDGATISFSGSGVVSGGSAVGGTGSGASGAGLGLGGAFFLHGQTSATFTTAAGETMTINDSIASDAFADLTDATNPDPAGDGLDGGLIHNGAGTLNLHGLNSYAGGTRINGGVVNVIAAGNLGNVVGDVTLDGGTLQWGDSFSTGRDFNLEAGDGVLDTQGFAATLTGLIQGAGDLTKIGSGSLILTNTETYTGATTVSEGTLFLTGAASIAASSNVQVDGALDTTGAVIATNLKSLSGGGVVKLGANALNLTSASGTFSGGIEGGGQVVLNGTEVFSGANTYTGGTTISAGTLYLGDGGTAGSIVGDVANSGALVFNRSNALTLTGAITGTGTVEQRGAGATTLTGDSSYTGGTTITGGVLRVGAGGTTGSIVGDVANDGALVFDRSNNLTFAGVISGAGEVRKAGFGTTTLTGTNTYKGATTVESGGVLRINGDQSAATGLTTVNGGGVLGGSGIIGDDVIVADGAFLSPGNSAGTLTINGDLTLANNSFLEFEFGKANVAGGTLNDLVKVGGDLVLDGVIDISTSGGGVFGPGVYRVFDYAGTLTDQGLLIGSSPTTSLTVQTSVAHQVNLVNTDGLALRFWDGDLGDRNDGDIAGGNGTWQDFGGNENWTEDTGFANAGFLDRAFAVFQGTAGTVNVDVGAINVSGMQFSTGGYLIQGGTITLAAADTTIRVGDGSAASDGYTATISSVLDGAGRLIKDDEGTLILSGANTYSGGTTISSGVLQVSNDANLGDAAGDLTFEGGTLHTTASITSTRNVALDGAGKFLTNINTTLTLTDAISGAGSLTKDGAGVVLLTGNSDYTGGTTISAGTLQLGNGAATGGLVGNVANNGLLVFNRSDDVTFAGAITGSGAVTQTGAGKTRLTGVSAYNGLTTVHGGELRVEGGGQVTAGGVDVSSGAANLTVSGSGSKYIASGDSLLGSIPGSILNVEDGGVFQNSVGMILADDLGETGVLNVSGPGSSFTSVGLTVEDGQGTINVTGGGTVVSTTLKLGGIGGSGTGTVVLSGTDSSLTTGAATVYRGSLSVLDGGVYSSTSTRLGIANGKAATVLVSGAGAQLITTASGATQLEVGGAGDATLTLMKGGKVTVAAGAGTLKLATSGTSHGVLNIGGAVGHAAEAAGVLEASLIQFGAGADAVNFNHTDTAYLFGTAIAGAGAVNHTGSGTTILTGTSVYTGATTVSGGELRLESGGQITTSNLEVVGGNGQHAVMTVDGIGSRLVTTTASHNDVGQFGTGILNIQNGGQADLASLNIAVNPPGNGTVNVDGEGSSLIVRGATSAISSTGNGVLNILNGATASYAGTANLGFPIGAEGGGAVTVSGDGSQWTVGNILSVNNGSLAVLDGGLVTTVGALNLTNQASQTGILTIASGGRVRPGNGALTYKTGTAILNIGGAEGAAAVAAGTLEATSVAFGTGVNGANNRINFNHTDTDYVFAAAISGLIKVNQKGPGRTILTADNTYTGATTITDGVLQLGNGGTAGWILGNVANDGALAFDRSDNVTFAGLISGSGRVEQVGAGRTILTANNTLTGGATIFDGALQLGAGGATGWIFGDVVDDGLLAFNRSDDVTFAGLISGSGAVEQIGAGRTILTADNTYTGGTTIAAATLQLGDGGTTGSIVGDVANNGVLAINRSDSVTLDGVISGAGAVNQIGGGKTILTGANSYAGDTTVAAGSLFINGDQSLATGLTTVASGATLGGAGTIGGDVDVADGGVIAPGNSPGTLKINGDLILAAASTLNFEFGQAGVIGGSFNDQIVVHGDLVLDGDLDVAATAGRAFGPGLYRVISYDGALTNNGLELDDVPASSDLYVQTSIANQVNLVNSTGVTLNFWDGAAGSKNDGQITGGDGLWQSATGADLWTDEAGGLNASYADGAFAIFSGAAGDVTVDNGLGAVTASGMQFASDGYTILGDAITLTGPQSIIMVGDGSGAAYTATINAELTGAAQLVKTDAGTLVLAGANTYTGGTAINGGVLSVASDANLGAGAGSLSIDGGVLQVTGTAFTATPRAIVWGAGGGGFDIADAGNTFTVAQALVGGGALTKLGDGKLVLTGADTYANGTMIAAGTLQLGDGGTTGSIVGDVLNDGVLAFNRSDAATFSGVISGSGSIDQIGSGTTILTAANTYTGGTTIIGGTLELGQGGSIVGDVANDGVLAINRSDSVTLDGVISGAGAVNQIGVGETVLTGNNSYAGGTTITHGVLRLGAGGTTGSIVGDVANDGLLAFERSDDVTFAGVISGVGAVNQIGAGTTILTGNSTYNGGTTISAGTLQLGDGGTTGAIIGNVANDGVLVFNRSDDVIFAGLISGAGDVEQSGPGRTILTVGNTYTGATRINAGALQLGDGGTTGSILGNVVDDGLLAFNRSDDVTFAGLISGSGAVEQIGAGKTILTADNTYTGVTTIAAATLQLGDGGTTGSIVGDVVNNGVLAINRLDSVTLDGVISGSGAVNQIGGGKTILTGANSYAGDTTVAAGSLFINGDQSLARGLTTVASGATLGGAGTIGGDVDVADGGVIAPGNSPGTLKIKGDLSLADASTLNYELGSAGTVGGSLNDLIDVGGDLILDGRINVTRSAGGVFDIGVYRVINYTGGLIDHGMDIGARPAGDTLYVQTSVANQINLVNAGDLTLNFWDGAAGPVFDGQVNGGDGVWQNSAGNTSWTDPDGVINATYADGAFAIFSGAAGNVTVDNSLGAITASGMQFASDGYTILGDAITLTDPQSIVRVGDGSGAAFTATINAELTGAAQLVKTDAGTLVLAGANTYTGGTAINGGVLSAASDANLGDGAGSLSIDGGVLQVTGTAFTATPRAIVWGADGGGFDIADAGNTFTVAQALVGGGALTKLGDGKLVLTGADTYADGTTIAAGTLQLGDGGTTGSIVGDVLNDGVLVFNHSDDVTFGGVISGSGSIDQIGSGTTILTAANSYAGATTITSGALLINGDQSAAKGQVSVNAGAALGGLGVIGGDVVVVDGATIAPGNVGDAPGKLTIKGDLSFADASMLNYHFGQANVVGGPFNDLIDVGGDLVLDGVLNVAPPAGGDFAPGLYRVIAYGGALTNNGLTVGAVPSPSLYVQTSVDHQVNLVNTAGLTLRYWDGAAGGKNDNQIDGDNGLWQNSTGNDNWTEDTGGLNAAFNDTAFAVFMGAPGTVKVDNSLGAVTASGMQFMTGGYKIEGQKITLTGGPSAFIRVGDGGASGAAATATIMAELTGASKLVKADLGTLILDGANTYAGGTEVRDGVLQISKDANLGAASTGLTLNGGALHTTADITTDRLVDLAGAGTIQTDAATTLTLNSAASGAGSLDKDGKGKLRLAVAASYAGDTTVRAGILAAGAANVFSAGSTHAVLADGGLDLDSHDQTVASLANAGAVRLGGAPGTTLAVTGNYLGNEGLILISAALGDDASTTDRVVIDGDTSGATLLVVANVGGSGAQTVEGIKLVDVAGASNGAFGLKGDYVFQGQQAVVGGAYGYRLYKNGVSTPADGDWYLRSALLNAANPTDSDPAPLYQPGVPVYEVYGQALLGLNGVSTLQQRAGDRAASAEGGEVRTDGRAAWGRLDGAHNVFEPKTSTSGASYDLNTWNIQAGLDTEVYANDKGQVIGSVSAHYGAASVDVASLYGQGQISTDGYGVGGALTWYGQGGGYIDGQAKLSWFDSDLSSLTAARSLAQGDGGVGYTFSVEAGQRFDLSPKWALVPQAQLAYSAVDFDTFADTFGARVSLDKNDSLKGRLGLAASSETSWRDQKGQAGRSNLYALANLHYEFLDGVTVDVSGAKFANANDKLWAGLGGGGTYSWADDRYSFYGEVSLNSSLANFGDSYTVSGTAGFRVKW